jgi:hypothetical protein
MTEKDADAVRTDRVRQLFMVRPERTKATILPFCGWLYKHHPELLPSGNDAYQAVKVDLAGLYTPSGREEQKWKV